MLNVPASASDPVVNVLVEPVPEEARANVAPLAEVVAPVTVVLMVLAVVLKFNVPALTVKLFKDVVEDVFRSVLVPLTPV